jgi:hypothetical protein
MKNAWLAIIAVMLSTFGLNAFAAQYDAGTRNAEQALPDELGPTNGAWG